MKKGIIAILLMLSLTASLFALFGCNGFSQKQVPVYQGMTISNAVSTATRTV